MFIFPCSADHKQDWQPYPVDPYSGYSIICDGHTYEVHLYILYCTVPRAVSVAPVFQLVNSKPSDVGT